MNRARSLLAIGYLLAWGILVPWASLSRDAPEPALLMLGYTPGMPIAITAAGALLVHYLFGLVAAGILYRAGCPVWACVLGALAFGPAAGGALLYAVHPLLPWLTLPRA